METDLLDLGHLPVLSNVASFLKSQQDYSTYYERLGRQETTVWQQSPRVSPKACSAREPVRMLDSPILKPRVPVPPRHLEGEAKPKHYARDKATRSNKENQLKPTSEHEPKRRNDAPKAVSSFEKGTAKEALRRNKNTIRRPQAGTKAATQDETGGEYLSRLAERKEKRRVKRAILRDTTSPGRESSEDRTSVDGSDRRVPSGKRQSSSKKNGREKYKKEAKSLPLGFALMESFSANNLRKERLTLKPSASVGVFSKGRASVKAHLSKLACGKADVTFSEPAFLGNGQHMVKATASDGAGSEIAPFDIAKIQQSSYFKGNEAKLPKSEKEPQVSSFKDKGSPASQATCNASRKRDSRAESPVWDIEMNEDLPEDAESLQSPIASPKPAIELVAPAPTDKPDTNIRVRQTPEPRTESLPLQSCPPSESSLDTIYPSNSASQLRHELQNPKQDHIVSPATAPCFAEELDPPSYVLKVPTAKCHTQARQLSPDLTTLELDLEGSNATISSRIRSNSQAFSPMTLFEDFTSHLTYSSMEEASLCYPYFSDIPVASGILNDDRTVHDLDDFLDQVSEEGSLAYFDANASTEWDVDTQPLEACSYRTDSVEGFEHDAEISVDNYEEHSATSRGEYLFMDEIDDNLNEEILIDSRLQTTAPSDLGDATMEDAFETQEEEPHFIEGRALLLGIDGTACISSVEQVEMEVAATLRGHWRPHRH